MNLEEQRLLGKSMQSSWSPIFQTGTGNRLRGNWLQREVKLNKKIGSLSAAADTFQPIIYYSQLQGPYNATPEPEDLAGTVQPEPWDLEQIFDRVILFAGKLSKRFKKPKKVVEEAPQTPTVKPGGEIAQELTDAWNLYTRVIQ